MSKRSISSIYKSIYSQLSKQNGLVKDFLELGPLVEEDLRHEISINGNIPLSILNLNENGIDIVLSNRENNKNFNNALILHSQHNDFKVKGMWSIISNIIFHPFDKLSESFFEKFVYNPQLPTSLNDIPLHDVDKSIQNDTTHLVNIIKELEKKLKQSYKTSKKLKQERDIFLTPKVKLNENVKVYLHLLETCDQEREITLELLESSSNYTRSKSSWHNDLKLLSFWLRLDVVVDEKINTILDKIYKTNDETKKEELNNLKVKLIFRQSKIRKIIEAKEKSRNEYKEKLHRNNIDPNNLSGNVNSAQSEYLNEYFKNQLNYKAESDEENYVDDEDKRGIREDYYSSLEDPYINNSDTSKFDTETDYNGSNDLGASKSENTEK